MRALHSWLTRVGLIMAAVAGIVASMAENPFSSPMLLLFVVVSFIGIAGAAATSRGGDVGRELLKLFMLAAFFFALMFGAIWLLFHLPSLLSSG